MIVLSGNFLVEETPRKTSNSGEFIYTGVKKNIIRI